MRVADSPFLADWFAVLLRWIALLGIAATLGLNDQLQSPVGVFLVGGVIWNVVVSLLAITNTRLPFHRLLNTAVDVLASGAIFWITDGFNGPLAWVGLIAITSGAIYYELAGGLVTALIFSGLQAALSFITLSPQDALIPTIIAAAFYISSGLIFGVVSRGLIRRIRGKYQGILRQRQEMEDRARQQEHDRMQAFYDLTATLSTTLSYQDVMDSTLDLGTRALEENPRKAEQLASAFLSFSGEKLEIGAARHLAQSDQRVTLPGTEGVLARALQTADPQLVEDPAQDPELCYLTGLQACKSVICLALHNRLDVYGVLLFGHSDPNYFDDKRREVLEIVARQATLAIQNALLYQNLSEEKQRLAEAQEETRKKLARDLHDGPTQTVSAIAMQAAIAARTLEHTPQDLPQELARIDELARRATQELRHMLFTLRPLALENQGLVPALQAMARKTGDTYQQNVEIDVDAALADSLETGKQTVIFYLVEEAVNNARKHAQAEHIWVRLAPLAKMPEIALLEIKDDGVGFDVKAVTGAYDDRGSLGMVNLKERTELISGILNITSEAGKGTSVQVYIPLTEAAAERMRRSG